MTNGDYEPRRPHRTAEANVRDYLEAKIDGNRELSDSQFKSQETAVSAALNAAKEAVAAALTASEKAIIKAEAAQQRVNEGQNEFRGTLKDQAATLMPRAETEILLREMRANIATLSDQVGNMRSRLDVGPPSLGVLQARSDEQRGRALLGSENRTTLLAIAGFGGALLVYVLDHIKF